jgi:hypothetical protein
MGIVVRYGETQEKRLNRFRANGPIEIIETLLCSIESGILQELHSVFDSPSKMQTNLMFLGTHSIALTLAHGFFGKDDEVGFGLFLKHFIDGCTQDTKFSIIASKIHGWRNVVAHRSISVVGHDFCCDFSILEGWKVDDGFLLVNPKIYLDSFLKSFSEARVYQYLSILDTTEKQEAAKERFISQYQKIPKIQPPAKSLST